MKLLDNFDNVESTYYRYGFLFKIPKRVRFALRMKTQWMRLNKP
jgi:hypothetical protein